MIVPWPVQQALTAALGDDAHVAEQKARYAARRATLRAAVEGFGLRVDHSDAGLYLWATRGEDAWATIDALAARGILAAPGSLLRRSRARARAHRPHRHRRTHRRGRRASRQVAGPIPGGPAWLG